MDIPGWHPVRLNRLLGAHWGTAGKLKKNSVRVVGVAAYLFGVPEAIGKRRLRLTIVLGPGQRGGDPDAYFKDLLDACVRNGLLIDDSKEWVELAPVRYDRGPCPRTIIDLEDLA